MRERPLSNDRFHETTPLAKFISKVGTVFFILSLIGYFFDNSIGNQLIYGYSVKFICLITGIFLGILGNQPFIIATLLFGIGALIIIISLFPFIGNLFQGKIQEFPFGNLLLGSIPIALSFFVLKKFGDYDGKCEECNGQGHLNSGSLCPNCEGSGSKINI